MFETLLSQNVCVYVIAMCGFMGVVGRMIMGGFLKSLIKETEFMGRTKKRALREIRKRYEDISSLDVEVRDTAAFVDKYIDRLKIGVFSANSWNAFVKNLGVIAAGTGIFAAGYQYYVVGDGGEAVKLLACSLAVDMVLLIAHNQWNPSLYMKTLRDGVMNYLGNSLSNRFSREDRRQVAAADAVSDVIAEDEYDAASERTECSDDNAESGVKKRSDVARRTGAKKAGAARSDSADYDKLLDKMMQKILADG